MYLGEVMAETLDKNFIVLADEGATAYLRQIGDRLVKHLPPTNIKFQFFVVDAPELNAFNVAGGRIYVTRKLISFVKTEDELAGILGHELGHAIVRHHAMDISKAFREILQIERVGGREDVFEKYNRFLDRQRTKRIKMGRGHEGAQQLEADRVGLFAMMAAGYDPNASATVWSRLTEIKAKPGSLDDFIGGTKPEEKRLREMLMAIGSIPADCRDKTVESRSDAFYTWQQYVVSLSNIRHKEKVRGLLAKGELRPFLRGTIEQFRFSPDGKYILAQDASGINILSRDPFKLVFRINVKDAKFASFTPDSARFVFQTYGLRVQMWDIASERPVLTREVYVRDDCLQTTLSPDGKMLVCYSIQGNLDLIDIDTNEKIFTKKEFYIPTGRELLAWRFDFVENEIRELTAMAFEFSPDGRYFIGSRVSRIDGGIGSYVSTPRRDGVVVYDLKANTEVKLTSNLRKVLQMPFAFYSSDRVIGQSRDDDEKSGLFSFPEGELVEKFGMRASSFEKPHKGEYFFAHPPLANLVVAYSVPLKKIILSNKLAAMDGYGDLFVSESKDGIIDLVKLSGEKMEPVGSVALPKNELGDIKTAAVSGSLDKLAISESDRGGVWELGTVGTGVMKLHIRGFRGSHFDAQGIVYADLPSYEQEPRKMAQLNSATGGGSMLEPIKTRNTKQFGRFLVRRKTWFDDEYERRWQKRQKKEGKDAAEEPPPLPDTMERARPMYTYFNGVLDAINNQDFQAQEASIEVYDAIGRSLLWSRKFENESPKYDVDARAETVSLYWPVMTKSAKEIIKGSQSLSSQLKILGEKEGDYLVQVLNASSGTSLGELLIETGEGSFSVEQVVTHGDWVAVIDSRNRVLFYSLKAGVMRSRVFGSKVLLNASRSIGIVENVPGVLAVIDLNDGKRLGDLRFPSSVAYANFSADENKLFVLTESQQYYIFDMKIYSPDRIAADAPEKSRLSSVPAR
ncbi:MAG TPA: M48 family metalloprotease [Pyrinomonadaceae bacterium]|nr:M48 family metalloprotease [Pyrinomonadaceae bacterium]